MWCELLAVSGFREKKKIRRDWTLSKTTDVKQLFLSSSELFE